MVGAVRGLSLYGLTQGEDEHSEADEQAFDAHVRRLAVLYGRRGGGFLLLAVVCWWPLDYVLWRGNVEAIAAFGFFRTVMGVSLALAWLLMGLPWCRRNALVAGPALYSALLGALGVALGRLGDPSLPWFTCANIAVVPLAFLPLPLRRRAVVLPLVVLPLPLLYFVVYPGYWSHELGAIQASFMAFTVAFTLFIGETLYGFVRSSFYQVLAIDRGRVAVAVLNASLEVRVHERTSELNRLLTHVETVREEQRARISRELHDDVGQDLTALRYTLRLAQRRFDVDPSSLGAPLGELSSLLERTTKTLRAVVSELRPAMLDEGLPTALEWLVARARTVGGLEVSLELRGEAPPPPTSVASAAYRVAQESLNNVVKHAEASSAAVILEQAGEGALTVSVSDDGRGFLADETEAGFGLVGMRERVHALGGSFALSSRPGGGTLVVARFVWESAERLGKAADPTMTASG